jgi:hypothetical protein
VVVKEHIMIRQHGFRAKFKSRQQGAVAIIVAICLVVLIGMLGLVLDLGHLYVAKSQLQNVADASALSGAKELDGTSEGVIRAYDKSREVALLNNYDFNSIKGFGLAESNLEFSSSPNGPWDSFGVAQASPAGKMFLKVDTGRQDFNTWFIHVLPGAMSVMRTFGMAVAGRFLNPITPIGVCAVDHEHAEMVVNGEDDAKYKAYYGFRKGVSYNFAKVNEEFGGLTSGTELYLHPTATSQEGCEPSDGNSNVMASFLCSGQSAISGATGSYVYSNTGLAAGMSIKAINTRFGDYGPPLDGSLNSSTCPADKNIKSFNRLTAELSGTKGWINPMLPGEQLEQTVVPKLGRWLSDPGIDTSVPTSIKDESENKGGCGGNCVNNYGIPWSYSREIQTDGTFVNWSDWSKKGLYPDGPTATWTHSETPYFYGINNPSSTEFFQAPTSDGVANRRLLNVVIVQCPGASPGICGELPVLGVGQFFIQSPAAVADFINGEFVKLLNQSELSGDIRLYR